MSWRVKEMCNNCPFRTDGKQISLAEERLDEIKQAVLLSQPFFCHKTVDYDRSPEELGGEDGTQYQRTGEELECAGALKFREEHADEIPQAYARLLAEVANRSIRRKKR